MASCIHSGLPHLNDAEESMLGLAIEGPGVQHTLKVRGR